MAARQKRVVKRSSAKKTSAKKTSAKKGSVKRTVAKKTSGTKVARKYLKGLLKSAKKGIHKAAKGVAAALPGKTTIPIDPGDDE